MERRHLLGLMGAAAATSGLSLNKSAKAEGPLLDPKTREGLYTIHRKLRYSLDESLVYWYIEAVRFGLMDTEFTPFWNMHVGFLAKVKDADVGYTAKGLTAIFYSDLDTGKILETFTNPYTGEKIEINQPGLRRSSGVYGLDGNIRNRPQREGMRMTQLETLGPAMVIGDDVWCKDDGGVRLEPTGDAGQLIHINDWTTYHGSISEVSHPDVVSANATQTFNDINTWPSWLNMGDRPGNYVSRGVGRKSWARDGMPPIWQSIMADLYPTEFNDLEGYIDEA